MPRGGCFRFFEHRTSHRGSDTETATHNASCGDAALPCGDRNRAVAVPEHGENPNGHTGSTCSPPTDSPHLVPCQTHTLPDTALPQPPLRPRPPRPPRPHPHPPDLPRETPARRLPPPLRRRVPLLQHSHHVQGGAQLLPHASPDPRRRGCDCDRGAAPQDAGSALQLDGCEHHIVVDGRVRREGELLRVVLPHDERHVEEGGLVFLGVGRVVGGGVVRVGVWVEFHTVQGVGDGGG